MREKTRSPASSRPFGRPAARPWALGLALSGALALLVSAGPLPAQEPDAGHGARSLDAATGDRFQAMDVFHLEWAGDPRISPDGSRVVYVRSGFDVMEDGRRSDLWLVDADGTRHRPLTTGEGGEGSPRWSPSGDRLLYVSSKEDGAELWVRWMDSGQTAKLTDLRESPGGIAWSPDGRWIAFTMFVPEDDASFAEMPRKPDGADWGPAIRVVDEVVYRQDGRGFLEDGHRQLFVLPAEGGTPRQLTDAPFDHGGPRWTPDGSHLILSANRHENSALEPGNSEIYEVRVSDGRVRALTDRHGPDGNPAISPDGSTIAYTGYDERYQGYQVTRLYLMARDGSNPRLVSGGFDRSVQNPVWAGDGSGVYFQYDDRGNTKVGFMTPEGEVRTLVGDVGGLSLGRPYSGGSYSVSRNGRLAFTHGRPDHPADVAVAGPGVEGEVSAGVEQAGQSAPVPGPEATPSPLGVRRLTALNDDLLAHKELGQVEEIWYESSHDGREIQGWILKPPGFDEGRSYPLILEIHGGPFANYGDRFSAEAQLYAAAGYVVLYTNPRGSTSYGQEFGNLIHHAYPGNDYHDLISGVDAVLERGYVDADRLYVTGGSGGGVLSAWIVGHTDRFRAAAVQKPVINWYSWVLTADMYVFGIKYWFPGPPWEHLDHYKERSPLSYVGNVTTPTMLVTGEVDYRTPMPESEQFYQALQYREVPSALVRIPDASHGIAARPSNLVAKVAHVLGWFGKYGGQDSGDTAGSGSGAPGGG